MNPSINVDRMRLSIQRMRARLKPTQVLTIDAPNEAAICAACLSFILAGEKRSRIGTRSRCGVCWPTKP